MTDEKECVQTTEKKEDKVEGITKEYQDKMRHHIAKAGEMKQTCSKCKKTFVPIEDGGSFDLDDGFRCFDCNKERMNKLREEKKGEIV